MLYVWQGIKVTVNREADRRTARMLFYYAIQHNNHRLKNLMLFDRDTTLGSWENQKNGDP